MLKLDFFFLEGEALGRAEGVRGRFSGCFPAATSESTSFVLVDGGSCKCSTAGAVG